MDWNKSCRKIQGTRISWNVWEWCFGQRICKTKKNVKEGKTYRQFKVRNVFKMDRFSKLYHSVLAMHTNEILNQPPQYVLTLSVLRGNRIFNYLLFNKVAFYPDYAKESTKSRVAIRWGVVLMLNVSQTKFCRLN